MFSCKFEYEADWIMPLNLSELGKVIAEHYPDSNFRSLTASSFSDKVEVIAEFGIEMDEVILKEVCMLIYNFKERLANDTTISEIVVSSELKSERTLNVNEISSEEKSLILENINLV